MKKLVLVLVFLISIQPLIAQENYVPSKENLEAREWFEDARFGLFIHWGVYSVIGDGEWVMTRKNFNVDDYEKYTLEFNPVKYDPVEWVAMAKAAGMKYITITTRHHDGFSMFDSKYSDYNIVKRSPYGKDILKPLAEACKKEGIKLCFYYSLLDWNRDDYFPRGTSALGITGRGEGKWEDYIAFMKNQLTELLTNYGEIAAIWFDGDWDQREGRPLWESKLLVDWHYDEIYKLIHDLQPQCLIGNNRHMAPLQGEDFQMFERELPGQTKTGFGTTASEVGNLPKEVCGTINGSWGYNKSDKKHKTQKELIGYLVKAAGFGSNLLLNVGPMPTGEIQPKHVSSLKKMGEWVKANGKTIYKTKEGPIDPTDDFVSTQLKNKVYIHVLNSDLNFIEFPKISNNIKKACFYKSKDKVELEETKTGYKIIIPENQKDEIDTIIELTLR